MLIVGRYARARRPHRRRATPSASYGGDEFLNLAVHWERHGNRVVLRKVDRSTSLPTQPLSVYRAVQNSNYGPVIATAQRRGVRTRQRRGGRRHATVHDERAGARGDQRQHRRDAARTSSTRSPSPRTSRWRRRRPARRRRRVAAGGGGRGGRRRRRQAQSVLAHWSMIKLPETPMRPRTADERIGLFTAGTWDFGISRAARRGAPVGHAVAPGVLGPPRGEPLLSQDSRSLLRGPGHARPVEAVDPEGHRGLAARLRGRRLQGRPSSPPIRRPTTRTGRRRTSATRWCAGCRPRWRTRSARTCTTRAAARSSTARRASSTTSSSSGSTGTSRRPRRSIRAHAAIPFPDSLMGRLLEFCVAHEVGHTIGLQHDQIGSSTYPADSVRSATWVRKMGHSPSVMDYSRMNYVAQPEDSIALGRHPPAHRPVGQVHDHVGLQADPRRHAPGRTRRPQLEQWLEMQDTDALVPLLGEQRIRLRHAERGRGRRRSR